MRAPKIRAERTRRHDLVDIITIALCAVICGADSWVETLDRAEEPWLRTFLALPGGIPSYDTFGRGFARLDPERPLGDTISQETRYYISSLPGNAQALGAAIRRHSGIENSLH